MEREKYSQHIFVKYGSSAINERIEKIEESCGLKYIHRHEGNKPRLENRNESYNGKMKIKACMIYKFEGRPSSFEKLFKTYNNLEIIADEN